jgi:ribonuclease HI
MHIDGQMFVISVTDPLNLTLQTKVQSENRLELGMVLQGHLAALRTQGFDPAIIYTDPHSSFRSMTQDFPGVELDIGGAGDYVSKADEKKCRIKETYQKVKSGLPWELPQQLVGDLVAYCVSRLNIRCTTALAENICPRVLFTGIPVDYRKELTFVFGDYVEAYEGTTNTSRARSSACIALFPAGNSTGMWILWKIDTRTRVRRSNIEKLVMTDRIISMMNMLAEEGQEDQEARHNDWGGTLEINQENDLEESKEEIQGENPEADPTGILQENPDESQVETPEETSGEITGDDVEQEETGQSRNTLRSGREIRLPSRYAAVTKVSQKEWQEEQASIAIKKEPSQLFEELVAIVPVKKN